MAFVGMEWIVVIIAIVLFLFGAKKIPELARSMGKARGEFTRGKRLVEMEMMKAESEVRIEPDPTPVMTSEDRAMEQQSGSPIYQAATELGIKTEGRSDSELKELIRKRVTGE